MGGEADPGGGIVRILAIDPGPTESAFVLWDGEGIWDKGKHDNEYMRQLIPGYIGDADYLVIEKIACYGMAVGASVFSTCVWSGRFMERWLAFGGTNSEPTIIHITRNEVKNHLCHSSKANDANIRAALIDRLGEPGTKKNPGATYGVSKDIWAALAVGLTAYDRLNQG